MSVDAAAQSTAPQTNSDFPDNADDRTKVSLSYKRRDHVGQQSNPLLHIPYEMMELYSLKPRKWLLYVATNICGVDGTLRFLTRGGDFTEQEMEQNVSPGDRYVFCYVGEVLLLDGMMRGTRHSQSAISTRSRVEPNELKEFYRGCPFTRLPLEICDVCHLVPHVKGDDYLHKVLAARGEPDNAMTVDDHQNLILMEKNLHAAFDIMKSVAFLKTPNTFLKTNELPGGEHAEPDDYRVTIHCFMGNRRLRNGLNHGDHSGMTRGAGLEDPPPQGEVVEKYRPKAILLDVTYAFNVLNCFGYHEAKEKVRKDAEKNHYPDGIIRRGEDREGKKKEHERERHRKAGNEKRDERASIRLGTGDDTGVQVIQGEKEIDMWDWILMATYTFRGIRPEDIEAEEKRREREMEECKAQRFAEWRDAIEENVCDKCVGDTALEVHDEDYERPVSIEEALSRSPPSYSIPPGMTYSSSTASDDSTDVSAPESLVGDEQGIEVALQGDKRPASLDLNISENTPYVEDTRKRRRQKTENDTPTHT